MSTTAQQTANQANARLSTGPTSAEGKQRSSQNALKHGFTSTKTILLPGEDEEAYNELAAGFQKDFRPGSTIERAMVEELTILQWRLLRVPQLEAKILSAEEPDYKALNVISLHAARMKRQFTATMKEVRQQIELRVHNETVARQNAAAAAGVPVPGKLDEFIANFIQREEAMFANYIPPHLQGK
jgi:hypothetical protein